MKYKVKTEFLPGVIVGQECEATKNIGGNRITIVINYDGVTGWNLYIGEDYAKQHPEIFQPIVEPVELKENETEFVHVVGCWGSYLNCKKCGSPASSFHSNNFCSNCGRKRKI